MLVSTSHKFIFIHIPKTAGTSIEHAFQKYVFAKKGMVNWLVRRLVKNFKVPNKSVFNLRTYERHTFLYQAEDYLPKEVFNTYFKFAVVRNPYDRFVSFYYHLKKQEKHAWHKYAAQSATLSEFIGQMHQIPEPSQLAYLKDKSGKMRADFVIRFEHIQEDFKKVCDRLGVVLDLPMTNTTKHAPYNDLYTEADKEFVYNLYKEDFVAFGYEK